MRRAKATKRSEIAPIVSFLPAPRPSFVGPLCRALSDCQTCRSEEHTSELQSPCNLVCRLLLEKKRNIRRRTPIPLTLRYHTVLSRIPRLSTFLRSTCTRHRLVCQSSHDSNVLTRHGTCSVYVL